MPQPNSPPSPGSAGDSLPVLPANDLPAVDRWNQQAWPPITFGVPADWTDVPPGRFGWLPQERRIPPTAPILQQAHVLAAVEHAYSGGLAQVQLRVSDNAGLARYVLEDPYRWAGARSQIGEPIGEPAHLHICGYPAVFVRYNCRGEEPAIVFYEAWLVHPTKGYHFVGVTPAGDDSDCRKAWQTMLQNTQEQGRYPLAVPAALGGTAPPAALAAPDPRSMAVERYRCVVVAQVPVTLENVTSTRPGGMFVIGSSSLAAWATLGAAAMTLFGRARAASLEGQTRIVPATGDAVLMNDRIILRMVVEAEVGGVRLRGDAAARTVNLEIPYRLIRQCGTDQGSVYLDVVGRGVIRLQPRDSGDFAQWLAHLSYNKTWQAPSPLDLSMQRPVVGWCQQDPRFTFGLPQQWVPVEPGPLADYGRLFYPSALRSGVLLGVGEWEAQVLVIDNGPVQESLKTIDAESLAALLASATEISPIGSIQAAALGGETVALLRGTSVTSDGVFDRCYGAFAHGGVLYALWYGVVGGTIGDGSYERWLPDFHSMMATWHWYA
jgi:hypothetical protein